MICEKCGKELKEGEVICLECQESSNPSSMEQEVPVKESIIENVTASEELKVPEEVSVTEESKVFEELPKTQVFTVKDAQTEEASLENNPYSTKQEVAVAEEQEINYSYDYQEQETKVEKRIFNLKKPVLIGIIAVLIIAASYGVYAKTDLFKSPKQIYLEAEGQNIFNSIKDAMSEYKKDYNKNVKPYLENPYETNIEYSADADLSKLQGIDSEVASGISKLLSNSKFVLNSKVNPTKNQAIEDMAVYLDNKKLISADFIQNDQQIAYYIPDFYSKYMVFDIKDFDNVMEKFGIKDESIKDNMPKKMITNRDIIKAVNFDEKKFALLLKDYYKFLGSLIKDDAVTMEKDVPFSINDFTFTTRKVTVLLNEKDFKDIINKLMEKAQKDNQLYELTVQNILNVLNLYKDAGYDFDEQLLEDLKKENFRQNFSEFRDSLNSELEQISFPNGVKMSLYLDGHNIIGRSFETEIDSSESVSINLLHKGLEKYKGKNISSFDMDIYTPNDNDFQKVSIKSIYNTSINKESEAGTANLIVNFVDTNTNIQTLNAKIDINNKDSKNNTYKYDIILGNTKTTIFSAKGTLDISNSEKEKENNTQFNFGIETRPTAVFSQVITANFNMKVQNKLGAVIKLPEFNDDNSVDLGKADHVAIEEIRGEINTSLERFAEDNKELLQRFIPQGY